ncbi:MAG: PQQ-binding-like beta-propeller repeat protein [Myxococcales bacterium]|nr:PQQ-binding-like beta-propeller repeat protein [Myxococcales bacterium]
MVRRAALVLAGCLLMACGTRSAPSGKVTMFTRVWTLDADAPYGDGTLRYATLADATSLIGGRVLATATGAARWTPRGIAVGLTADGVIEKVEAAERITGLRIADPASGATVREVAFVDAAGAAVQLRAFNVGLTIAGGRLVHSYLGRSQALDLATGRQLWQQAVRGTSSVVVAAGDRLGLVGDDGLIVVDAATGAEQWRAAIDGTDTDVVASPRGGFFVPRGERVVELAADGREVRAVAGRFSAADGEFLAVMHGKDVVVVDGGGAEVARIAPRGGDDYLAAPGLCGRAVVYFRRGDQTVWWHPASGDALPVVKLEARRGEIEGQPRTVGPTLTEPPRCVGGLVLIQDWNITAYRIPS